MVNSKPLTRDQALAMQDALLAEYMKPAFQEKLRTVLKIEAGSRVTPQCGEFERELREIRETVGAKFGYAASPAGVAQSMTDFTLDLRNDPEIAKKCRQMEILLFPKLQDEYNLTPTMEDFSDKIALIDAIDPLGEQKQVEPAPKRVIKQRVKKSVLGPLWKGIPIKGKPNRLWNVVGGKSKGGIVVRRGESIQSPEIFGRLATGSVVLETELVCDRLHYRKVSGEGPDNGWVSVSVNGTMLLEPQESPSENQQQAP